LFSRIVYGTRVSLTVAFVGPLISLLVGVVFGCVSGYFGGRVDNLMMRFVDVMFAFPALLLIILMMAFFRSSFAKAAEPGTLKYAMNALDAQAGGMLFIFIGIGVTSWQGMARLARGQVLSLREKEFVEAARAMGAGNVRIMFRHILPNIVGPLIVAETLAIPTYINLDVSELYRPGGQPAHAVVGGHDRGRGAHHPHVSAPGDLSGPGAGDHHVRVQLSGRWPARRARPAHARHAIVASA
jgi:oligopeptide transport system permease protein